MKNTQNMHILLYTYMNSLETIINNLDIIDFYNIFFLCNNKTKSLLLKDQAIS